MTLRLLVGGGGAPCRPTLWRVDVGSRTFSPITDLFNVVQREVARLHGFIF